MSLPPHSRWHCHWCQWQCHRLVPWAASRLELGSDSLAVPHVRTAQAEARACAPGNQLLWRRRIRTREERDGHRSYLHLRARGAQRPRAPRASPTPISTSPTDAPATPHAGRPPRPRPRPHPSAIGATLAHVIDGHWPMG